LDLRRSRLICGALSALVAVVAFAACGSPNLAGIAPLRGSGSAVRPHWKDAELLYVGDAGYDRIDIFTYPQGEFVGAFGEADGVSDPQGECTDSAGNVYVANKTASNILVFDGGFDPPAAMKDPGYSPLDCGIDPTTSDIAVANGLTVDSKAGNVAVYTSLFGKPTHYTAPNFYSYFYCGYDSKGDLFVDGEDSSNYVEFAELPKGGTKFVTISVNKAPRLPGALQWDGKYLAMSDPGSKVIYRLQIRGSQATVVGTTTFKGPAPFGDFSIVPQGRHEKNGAVLIAAGTGDVGSLYFWNYPAGGRSFKKISGLNFVSGVAKSVGL
jgi:hypothetical protein